MARERDNHERKPAAATAGAAAGVAFGSDPTLSPGQRATLGVARKAGGTLRKGILTALAVGGMGAVAGLGTFSAFSATTANSGNNISSGTVKIDQHTGATTPRFTTSPIRSPATRPRSACGSTTAAR
jgi:hypothetical protein